jgi:hypothetical protein
MLRHRWFFIAVVCLGVVLGLPSLEVGLVADDYTFIQRLEDPEQQAALRLYEFATGEPGQEARLLSARWAAYPWWIESGFKVRFLRPLSSALFALDHALFGRAPLGYHVHCLLWYGLLLVAVGLLLRRISTPGSWQLPFLLFTLNASHAESLAWISSRHVLISTVPALFGLLALLEWQMRGWRLGLPLGILGMALGLLGGEMALSVACYWVAYCAFGAPAADSARKSVLRVVVPLAAMAGYVVLYKALGYGVAGSGAYLDPISMPRAFWPTLPGRLAILLAELWAGFPSNLSLTLAPVVGKALGVVMTLGVTLLLRAVWPALDATARRTLLWLSVGALLSMLLNAGAFLGSRLLLIPGISAVVIIATLLRHGWRAARSRAGALASRAVVVCLAFVHVGLAPLLLPLNCHLLAKVGQASDDVQASLAAHFREHRARGSTPPRVFILAASDPFTGFYGAAVQSVRAPDATGQWSMVSMAHATHLIERTGPSELLIHVEPGMLRSTFEGLFRPVDSGFSVGDRRILPGGFVTVLSAANGRPTTIGLTLTRGSFDDNDVCLLAWRGQAMAPVRLAVHQKLSIPWSPGPTGLL